MRKYIELCDISDHKTKYGFIVIHTDDDNSVIKNTIWDARVKAEKSEDWCIDDIIEYLPKEWNTEYDNFDLSVGV